MGLIFLKKLIYKSKFSNEFLYPTNLDVDILTRNFYNSELDVDFLLTVGHKGI